MCRIFFGAFGCLFKSFHNQCAVPEHKMSVRIPPSLCFSLWHKDSALIDRWDPVADVQQLCASLAAQRAHAGALGPDIFSEQESLGSCYSYFLPSQLLKTEPKVTRFAWFSDWRAADVSSPTHPRPPAVAQFSAFYFRCRGRARNSGNRPSLFWLRKIF